MLRIAAAVVVVALGHQASTSFGSNELSAMDRLKSCDQQVALLAVKETLDDAEVLEVPLGLFTVANVLFQNGKKDEAVFWFYAAQLRVRYQLAVKKDNDSGQLLSIMLMTVGPAINNYAFQDVQKLTRILNNVLDWDRAAPNPLRDVTIAADSTAQVEAVYSGFRELQRLLVTSKEELEGKAREAAPAMDRRTEEARAQACRPGRPDPAYARQTIESEKVSVIEFAKGREEVLRAAGPVKSAFVGTYKMNSETGLPSRYTVSVVGEKTPAYVHAEVDVLRSLNGTTFALACITHLWVDERESPGDICSQ